MVTPLGCGVEATWSRLIAGKRRAPDRQFEVSDCLPDRLPGPARRRHDGTFNPDDWMEPKDQRKVDDFIVYAVAAAEQALRDMPAGSPRRYEDQCRTGVLIGSGIGGLPASRRPRSCSRKRARAASARSSFPAA
jgi:3-oxoacyl-[acyl-carrier-protein] synthase II